MRSESWCIDVTPRAPVAGRNDICGGITTMSVVTIDQSTCPHCSELVWDRDRLATATAGPLALAAGDVSDWTPDLLLATAVGTSLLTTFARLASDAGLDVLGYVAQQTADHLDDDERVCSLHVTPCITVATEAAAARARELWRQALEVAPIMSSLKCPVRSEPHIVVLPDATAMDPEC